MSSEPSLAKEERPNSGRCTLGIEPSLPVVNDRFEEVEVRTSADRNRA